jgi:GT2 family glycosyltransferase
MPRFSVVTATLGRPVDLRAAVAAVRAQRFGDCEHVVVADGSEDHRPAADIVAGCGVARVRRVRLGASRGPAGARNAGIEAATGDLVAILDDDDRMTPGRLARTAAAFDADPELVLVGGAFDVIDAGGVFQAIVRVPLDERELRARLPDTNPFVCHSTLTVRASVLRALGGYRTPLRYAHDSDMILRAAERGRITALPDVLARCAYHTGGISGTRYALQGEYAAVARRCAARRARGEDERLDDEVAAIAVPDTGPGAAGDTARAEARLHYLLGEWKLKDGRAREARPHFRAAFRREPFRPLTLALLIACYTPKPLRRLLGPLLRPLVALRYKSWR